MIRALLGVPACASELTDALLLLEARVRFSRACDHETYHLLPQRIRLTWYRDILVYCVAVGAPCSA